LSKQRKLLLLLRLSVQNQFLVL